MFLKLKPSDLLPPPSSPLRLPFPWAPSSTPLGLQGPGRRPREGVRVGSWEGWTHQTWWAVWGLDPFGGGSGEGVPGGGQGGVRGALDPPNLVGGLGGLVKVKVFGFRS